MNKLKKIRKILNEEETITQFSPAYYSARKSYALYSGLLLLLELLGAAIGPKVHKNWDITFETPGTLGLALTLISVFYGIRYTIEWLQSDKEQRKKKVSIADFIMSHSIAVIAISLFYFQATFGQLYSYIVQSPRGFYDFSRYILWITWGLSLIIHLIKPKIIEFMARQSNQSSASKKIPSSSDNILIVLAGSIFWVLMSVTDKNIPKERISEFSYQFLAWSLFILIYTILDLTYFTSRYKADDNYEESVN